MTQILNSNRNKRVAYLDLLRILAIFAVIFQHFCPGYYNADDFNKNAVNIMVSLTDWCVPVFVMISGALLLNPQKEFSVKRFFKKNVLRIFVASIFHRSVERMFHRLYSAVLFTDINCRADIVFDWCACLYLRSSYVSI